MTHQFKHDIELKQEGAYSDPNHPATKRRAFLFTDPDNNEVWMLGMYGELPVENVFIRLSDGYVVPERHGSRLREVDAEEVVVTYHEHSVDPPEKDFVVGGVEFVLSKEGLTGGCSTFSFEELDLINSEVENYKSDHDLYE